MTKTTKQLHVQLRFGVFKSLASTPLKMPKLTKEMVNADFRL